MRVFLYLLIYIWHFIVKLFYNDNYFEVKINRIRDPLLRYHPYQPHCYTYGSIGH